MSIPVGTKVRTTRDLDCEGWDFKMIPEGVVGVVVEAPAGEYLGFGRPAQYVYATFPGYPNPGRRAGVWSLLVGAIEPLLQDPAEKAKALPQASGAFDLHGFGLDSLQEFLSMFGGYPISIEWTIKGTVG